MAASLAPSPIFSAQDDTGAPLVGGLLFTYLTGSNTPTPSYTDASGTVANTNPIVLDDYGQAEVWLSAAVTYRFVLALPGDGDAVTPPTDPIWTVDNISIASGVTSIGGVVGAIGLAGGLFMNGQTLTATVPRGYIDGLILSTAAGSGSTTFSITPGQASDSTDTAIMTLAVALNKTNAAFGPGNGNGALDTGAIGAGWYHTFIIENPTTGATDILVSLSPTAPTMPAGYTIFRRIGALLSPANTWASFIQNGDTFSWLTPPEDVNTAFTTTAPTLETITVPTGVVVQAINSLNCSNGTGTEYGCLSSPATGGLAAGVTTAQVCWAEATGLVGQAECRTFTNTAAQVYAAVSSAVSTQVQIATKGWVDPRGRNA